MKKRIFITGATGGIGSALTELCLQAGHTVFATGRNAGLLEDLKTRTGCLGRIADLALPDEVLGIYAAAREALGRVDVLVNNAGFNHRKDPLPLVETADFDAQYAVNLRAPFLLCREALKDMKERQTGHIVNIISTVAKNTMENYSVYQTMKYGFHGFTGSLIKEARQFNVKVTGVYPGGVNTRFRKVERTDYMDPRSAAWMILQVIDAPEDVVVHDLTFRPMVETNF